ncbi:hypothetical protein EDB92DRAFT_1864405 [Lactarius akahatsu]|uniref:Secreted protein n=1 Tax=Lactarius akahatsu TaxID=416441 RepID=A0AAD4LIC8_9AGAM|nr:hypothetical protein EDB92DRAFT_1864405 [Lactarius akahatsu]
MSKGFCNRGYRNSVLIFLLLAFSLVPGACTCAWSPSPPAPQSHRQCVTWDNCVTSCSLSLSFPSRLGACTCVCAFLF